MPIAIEALTSMTDELDISPSSPHDEEDLNNVPSDINSEDHGDDDTEDELSESEGSDAAEDGGAKKKKKKKKVGRLLGPLLPSFLIVII